MASQDRATEEPDKRIGRTLQGRYKLAEAIAEGGMGVVYRAERIGVERDVVVKFLHRVLSDQPGVVDRFEREARATARLNHPHCVGLIDFGIDDGAPYLVMEFVEGKTLADVLDHGALEAERALRVTRQILAGLAHAHARGILHRDLKPANVMLLDAVEMDDFVKILDFGLAKLVGPDESMNMDVTVAGIAIGTPGYMSPEQAAGVPSDKRSDIYCAGALLYHLVTGKKAFSGEDIHSILRRHREEAPPSPRKITNNSISMELERVILKSMERDPARRYQSAEEMIAAVKTVPEWPMSNLSVERAIKLSDSFAGDSTKAEQPSSRRAVVTGRPRRMRWWVTGALMGTVTGLMLAWLNLVPAPPQVFSWVPSRYQGKRPKPVVTAPAPAPTPTPPAPPKPVVATPPTPTPTPPVVATTDKPPVVDAPPKIEDTDAEDDGANEDDREPPALPPGAPTPTTSTAQTIADVQALIKKGDDTGAIAALYQLRKLHPVGAKQAEIATLLGHLYFDKRWWTDALREYRFACHIDPRRRSDSTLINNTVRTLGDKKTAARARLLLLASIGRSAIPALRLAAKTAPTPDARRRAQSVLEDMHAGKAPARPLAKRK